MKIENNPWLNTCIYNNIGEKNIQKKKKKILWFEFG